MNTPCFVSKLGTRFQRGVRWVTGGKRGVSQAVVAILLIVVAVVAGASVYLYVNHTAQANMLGGDMMVGYHSLTLTGGQTAYLQITVQDTGTISLENIQVYLAGAPLSGPGVQCSGIPQSLSPGESAAITCVITSFTDCTGNAYGPAYIAPITKTQMQTWTVAEGHGRVIPFPPVNAEVAPQPLQRQPPARIHARPFRLPWSSQATSSRSTLRPPRVTAEACPHLS